MPSRGTRVVQRVIGQRGGAGIEAVHSRYTCKRACRRQQCGSISGRLFPFTSIDIIDRSNERQSVSWKRVCKFLHPSCFLPSFLLPPQLLIAVQSFLEHRLYIAPFSGLARSRSIEKPSVSTKIFLSSLFPNIELIRPETKAKYTI